MLTGDDRGEGGGLRFADVSENIEFSKFENTISKLFRSQYFVLEYPLYFCNMISKFTGDVTVHRMIKCGSSITFVVRL